MMGARILVVDDEPDIVDILSHNLVQAGHTVVSAHDGATGLAAAKGARPDLIVLDLMLPDIAGTEVCKRLRLDPATRSVPILMLTARADEIDRVVGLELGADDYVTKPFSVREIVLRVGAILRRTAGETPIATADHIRIGPLDVDVGGHRATIDGKELTLTHIEFKLLVDLASQPGRVQTRESLLERVWGYAHGVETRTVDTHVKRLREKLGKVGPRIETLRGVGYRMRP